MAMPSGRRIALWSIALLLVLSFAGFLWGLFYRPPLTEVVADMLHLERPPATMRVVDYNSAPTTDVVQTASIEIHPSEFRLLLNGYTFEEEPIRGTSHGVVNTKTGPLFEVTTKFDAYPVKFDVDKAGMRRARKPFPAGGSVCVYADSTRSRAVVDLYIE